MNNDNLIPFKPKVTSKVTPSDPQADIVKALEEYLKAAKEGKIKFIALATVSDEMVAYSTWEPAMAANPQLITAALGAVGYLHHRYNASCDAGSTYDVYLRPDDDPKSA